MRRALEEPPPPEQLTGVLAQLGAAEMLVDGPRAIEHLGAAFERIREPPFKVAVAELLARALILQERVPEAVGVVERTLETIPDGDRQLARRMEVVLVETSLVNSIAFPAEAARTLPPSCSLRSTPTVTTTASRAMLSLAATAEARTLERSGGGGRRSRQGRRAGGHPDPRGDQRSPSSVHRRF